MTRNEMTGSLPDKKAASNRRHTSPDTAHHPAFGTALPSARATPAAGRAEDGAQEEDATGLAMAPLLLLLLLAPRVDDGCHLCGHDGEGRGGCCAIKPLSPKHCDVSSKFHCPPFLSSAFPPSPPPPPSLARRMASFVKTLAVCSLLAFASVNASPRMAARQTNTSAPTATVTNGTYQGLYSAEYDQDFFLGMRYAQPAERFHLAQPLNTTWTDTALATAYPPHCVGYGSDDIGYTVSEDCLYLNVVRPAGTTDADKLPVAVWIHGGGLVMGGSADKRYNLSFIVQNSVELGTPIVAVSLNYRLSAYGFLCGSEALESGITNNGFRDQRQALRWINENVAAFGGDPAKVTIWGESSGAESLNAQVLAYNGQ